MKQSKFADIAGTLVLLAGAILAFLPHAFHSRIGLDADISHAKHIATGLILIVLGLFILAYSNKAFRFQK